MTTDNIHQEIQNLLAAFEQKLLTPTETSRVEEHLYECDECFQIAKSFSQPASLLRNSNRLQEEIALVGNMEDATTEKTSARSSSSGFDFTKYLLAAMLVMAVAIPSFMMFSPNDLPDPSQKIILLPLRSTTQSVVDLDINGTLEIAFASEELAGAESLEIRLYSPDEKVLFENKNFNDLSKTGMGAIIVETSILKPGRHRLEISKPGSTTPLRIFYFMAE